MYLREKNLFKFSIERDFMQTTTNPELKKNDLYKYINKADELYKNNSFKDAISFYLNAILIDRKSAESYFGLGICYKNLGEYEKAIKYLETATELRNNYYEAYYELGICHQLQGKACGAIKNFVQAIQSKPDSTEVILQLGISHEICEEYDLALMIYQKLIENSPDFEKAYEHKSALLMRFGNYREAGNILNTLIKINPKYKSAYAGLGICFEKLGQKDKARRCYRKFLTFEEFSPQTDFILERFNSNIEKVSNSRFAIVK